MLIIETSITTQKDELTNKSKMLHHKNKGMILPQPLEYLSS
jgi:hypothetical protein